MKAKIRLIWVVNAVFLLFFIIIGRGEAYQFGDIYHGGTVVDLEITLDSAPTNYSKYELYREGKLLYAWTNCCNEAGVCNYCGGEQNGTRHYFSDTVPSPGIYYYFLKHYLRSDLSEELHEINVKTITVDTTIYAGSLHNSVEWQTKLFRGPVNWSGSRIYEVGGLDIIDGDFSISGEVHLSSMPFVIKENASFYANGATFIATDAAPGALLYIQNAKAPEIQNSHFQDVTLRLESCDSASILNNTYEDTYQDEVYSERYDRIILYNPVSSGSLVEGNSVYSIDVSNGNPEAVATTRTIRGNHVSRIYATGYGFIIEENTITGGESQDDTNEYGYLQIDGTNNIARKNNLKNAYIQLAGSTNQILENHIEDPSYTARSLISIPQGSQCDENLIKGNIIQSFRGTGINLLGAGSGNIVLGNIIRPHLAKDAAPDTGYGIQISLSTTNSLIKKNFISGAVGTGIWLVSGSHGNNVEYNTILDSGYGIAIGSGAYDNIIIFNHVGACATGIYLDWDATGNGFHQNMVVGNGEYGFSVYGNDNLFFDNMIYNNGQNAYIGETDIENKWNKVALQEVNSNIVGGRYLAGNFWGDYTGTDGNGDGIGDTPYAIHSYAGQEADRDELPLVYGTATGPAAEPTSLTFDQGEVGTVSASQTVTVTNTAGNEMDLGLFYLAGLNPSSFHIAENGASGTTLAPGESAQLTITFIPGEEGPTQAALQLSSAQSFSMLLTGKGVSPKVGDLNSDFDVTIEDVIIALKVVAGITITDIRLEGDVNGDGKINVAEALFDLQTISNMR